MAMMRQRLRQGQVDIQRVPLDTWADITDFLDTKSAQNMLEASRIVNRGASESHLWRDLALEYGNEAVFSALRRSRRLTRFSVYKILANDLYIMPNLVAITRARRPYAHTSIVFWTLEQTPVGFELRSCTKPVPDLNFNIIRNGILFTWMRRDTRERTRGQNEWEPADRVVIAWSTRHRTGFIAFIGNRIVSGYLNREVVLVQDPQGIVSVGCLPNPAGTYELGLDADGLTMIDTIPLPTWIESVGHRLRDLVYISTDLRLAIWFDNWILSVYCEGNLMKSDHYIHFHPTYARSTSNGFLLLHLSDTQSVVMLFRESTGAFVSDMTLQGRHSVVGATGNSFVFSPTWQVLSEHDLLVNIESDGQMITTVIPINSNEPRGHGLDINYTTSAL